MRSGLLVFAILLVPILAGFDCSGEGGSGTKLSQCIRLGEAYCDQEIVAGCVDPSEPCVSQDCYDIFDDKCKATAEERELVDHDIANIIKPKMDCAALRSVEDYLLDTVWVMSSSKCGNPGAYDSLGTMCGKLIDAYCQKNIDLGCFPVTKSECSQMAFSSAALPMGPDYKCTTPDDDDAPAPENLAYYNEIMLEIKATMVCP